MVEHQEEKQQPFLYRFLVGILIGSGFIVPGVSGGALAAIFGIYERIIGFLANLTKNFKENVLYFIPVGLGALFGIVLFSFGVSYLLANYATIVSWFFVGCILGSAPALWREAGKEGRSHKDLWVLAGSFIFGIVLLQFGSHLFNGQVEANFISWFISGALIALGILVPGLSPSNFILYMGLYEKMATGFKQLDLAVLIPIGLGGLATIILLSKLIERIFRSHYSVFFHFIFGIVLASTIEIIPREYTDFGLLQYLLCFLTLLLGTGMGWWMAQLEEKYK